MAAYRVLRDGSDVSGESGAERAVGFAEYLATSQLESQRLVEAALAAGLDAAVPTCPGWTVGGLLKHVGGLARGVTDYLRTGNPHPPTEAAKQSWFVSPPAGTDLVDWYAGTRAELAEAFLAADPQTAYFSFLPAESPLLFWARRNAHETAIHRADVQLAAGAEITPYEAAFARDGIAELLAFTALSLRADPGFTIAAAGSLLHVGPADCTVAPDSGGPVDLRLVGPASAVYLTLWNRTPPTDVQLAGDPALLDYWRNHARWEL
ncbi:maleylpyruvate isomerase family mycothiol-dependent enzyme [Kribbella sp. NBC_01505]|uniref:maleylpyruvate isomerase family mycothiol-dependent enzyme n=1 Tax=Kribbella sp. NBC_01505 TaxID=2903580 RepID=UPI00386727D3